MDIDPANTAFTITIGIISAIVDDILEHNSKVLEGTFAGRVLTS